MSLPYKVTSGTLNYHNGVFLSEVNVKPLGAGGNVVVTFRLYNNMDQPVAQMAMKTNLMSEIPLSAQFAGYGTTAVYTKIFVWNDFVNDINAAGNDQAVPLTLNADGLPIPTPTPVSTPMLVKINFQPFGPTIPEDYLPDYGMLYADRGNGYTYGWDQLATSGMKDRNAPHSDDQRYDTLNGGDRPQNMGNQFT